ncbi:MAG: SWIM zinc finger family protein [Sandaracinus sp.]
MTAIEYRYAGRSGLVTVAEQASLGLATNTLREPVFFDADLERPLVLREGLGALRSVLTSDLKWHPRDRVAFRAWLEAEDRRFVESLAMKSATARAELLEVDEKLAELDRARAKRRAPFAKARAAYEARALGDSFELQKVLDPVVTVHPDELSFEAFSSDQSSYARLAVRHDLFGAVRAFECGTTNVDFSRALATHVDRMRSYRTTRFTIGPSGLGTHTSSTMPGMAGAAVHEKRIALPDSWLAGFLQVHALMSMGLTRVQMAPIDAWSIVRALARRKARTSPRALRWELRPGERVKVVLEPWEAAIELSPESRHHGTKPMTIRTWGRDRLKTLARVLPIATRLDVHLAGTGLPSVWLCDLGDEASFTLALSGWTDNDWVEGPAKFDLLTRRSKVAPDELTRVYEALRGARKASDESLATSLALPRETVRSALSLLCQSGRAMIDLATGLHRHRDLLLEPFVAKSATASVTKAEETSDPTAKDARALFDAGEARIIARRPFSGGHKLSGNVKDGASRARPQIVVDLEGQITEATCTCAFAEKNGLTKGPCVHMLALRLAHQDRLAKESA